jgi:aryl-alcohol dehydrogenase-like predicted oxidoreductase
MPEFSRREFLAAGAGAAALPLIQSKAKARIPRRKMGKTGLSVSILGLGGGSQFLKACGNDDEAIELVSAAIDGGINYLDSAWGYGNGESLRRYGLVVGKRRAEVYLTSKTGQRGRDGALREVESSRKNLRTDHIDVMQIHDIKPDEDVERILANDGVYRALLELKAQKVVGAV